MIKDKNVDNGKRWLCIVCRVPDQQQNVNESIVTEDVSVSSQSIIKSLKLEIDYLNQLIYELKENNRLLIQNNQLLAEKVSDLKEKLESTKTPTHVDLYKNHNNTKTSPNSTIQNTSVSQPMRAKSDSVSTTWNARRFDSQRVAANPPESIIAKAATTPSPVNKGSPPRPTHVVTSHQSTQSSVHQTINKAKRNILIGTGETTSNAK